MKRGILVCGIFALLWVNFNFANAAPASQASSAASQPDRSVEDLRNGESVSMIRRLGFSIADSLEVYYGPEPLRQRFTCLRRPRFISYWGHPLIT